MKKFILLLAIIIYSGIGKVVAACKALFHSGVVHCAVIAAEDDSVEDE